MRNLKACVALLATTVAAPAVGAQSAATIASRVASAADGEVRLTYASRHDACGDGRDVISIGHAYTVSGSMESYGSSSGFDCVRGPVHLTLTVRDHEVAVVRPRIGRAWPSGGVALDLGTVPAAEAARYLLSLAPRVTPSKRTNPLFAAALADSVDIAPDLLRLAHDATLPLDTRRRAVNLVGVVGDRSAVAPLVGIARSGTSAANADDAGPGDGLQGAATGALAMLGDDAGVPALMDLARHGSESVRKGAVFWLGQSDVPSAHALVRTVIDDGKETDAVRGSAIFALGQGRNETPEDAAFLRAAFDRLQSERLKDRILMAVSQGDDDGGTRWLLDRARDTQQPLEVRRKAVFWAGQAHASAADLVSLYGSVREPRLREHVLFVLSQSGDDKAVDALMNIARSDEDHAMRSKALFWLAQKNDPRVAKMIAEIVAR